MQFTQLLQQIEELETIIQESNKETKEKYNIELEFLNKILEEKIRNQKLKCLKFS